MGTPRAYVEHAAIHVADLDWHVRFFAAVLGMGVRDTVAGPPRQVWTVGGVQLIETPGHAGPEGRLAHLGIMAEDQAAVLRAAAAWGVRELPQGPNWLALPDGLCVEILQAAGSAVTDALAINPRA